MCHATTFFVKEKFLEKNNKRHVSSDIHIVCSYLLTYIFMYMFFVNYDKPQNFNYCGIYTKRYLVKASLSDKLIYLRKINCMNYTF